MAVRIGVGFKLFIAGGFVGGLALVLLAVATSINPQSQIRQKTRRANGQQGFAMETRKASEPAAAALAYVTEAVDVPEPAPGAGHNDISITGDDEDLPERSEQATTQRDENAPDIRKLVADNTNQERKRGSDDSTKSFNPSVGIAIAFGEPPRLPVASP